MRTSEVRPEMTTSLRDADLMYVVYLYEDGKLIEKRKLPGKNFYYAKDVSENWDNGIIKNDK